MYEIIFQYGRITISSFNLLLAVAFIMSALFLVRYIRFKKMKLAFLINNFQWFLIFPLIGGRIFYIFEHLALYKTNLLQIFFFWDMGFSAIGLFYTFIITLFLLTRRDNEDFWIWLDAFALTGLVGIFFISIGHFLKGNHYGSPTDLPWGMRFDTELIAYLKPIHPTQLYTSISAFIIFAIGMKYTKRMHLSGVIGTFAIMLYSLSAFGIDYLHGTQSIYIKINHCIIAAIAFIFYINCSHKKLLDNNKI